MPTKCLAGNWKMFKNRAEVKAFFAKVGSSLASSRVRKVVAPSPTLLETALTAAQGTGIEVFSQNAHWSDSGAFTGEMSPAQLVDLGVKGAIIAHSERRQYFGETDETAVQRALACLERGLDVIYCIGERVEQRKAGETNAVLKTQLSSVISKILPKAGPRLMIAYEPVWAIGTGLVATPEQVKEAHAFIAGLVGNSLPLLYGGSVKADNFAGLASLPHVDGGLVGGASLEADSYIALHGILDKSH